MHEQSAENKNQRKKQASRAGIGLFPRNQAGFTLIELMIAITILAVGMVGVLPMFLAAMSNNFRSRSDTQGILVAQLFLEQLAAVPSTTDETFTVNDCASTPQSITVNTAGSAAGTGANLDSNNNIIWQGVSHASIPSGYTTYYQTCGASQTIYEVRWNIKNPAATNLPSTKLISVSATPQSGAAGTMSFIFPTTLHAISGTY